MRQSDWLELAALIHEMWPASKLPAETISAWWPLVAELDTDAVRAAIHELALQPDRRHAPPVGELRAAVEAHEPRPWEDALAEIVAAARHATVDTPQLDDPVADTWARRFGWQRLAAMRETDLASPAFRAQFRDAYLAGAARAARGHRRQLASAVAGQLTGGRPALEGGG